eukprot:2476011-Alexandrium_andersonii.AAC.1
MHCNAHSCVAGSLARARAPAGPHRLLRLRLLQARGLEDRSSRACVACVVRRACKCFLRSPAPPLAPCLKDLARSVNANWKCVQQMRVPHSCYDGRVWSGIGGIGLMGGGGVALVAEGSGAGRLLG